MRKLLFIFSLLIVSISTAQELNCTVNILTPQIQGEKRIFETLQKSIYEFMNNTRWTKDIIKIDERIECSMQITVSNRSNDQFTATIQVQSRRPIFKSSYNSVLLNYIDENFNFTYVEYQPLEYNDNAYISNLTSILAFYAYMVIGWDYDSYSPNGGTPFFQKAIGVVNNAQNDQGAKGWRSFESQRNRYWMVNNLIDPVFAPIRDCYYKYHRLGLDVMQQNINQGRASIIESLNLIQKVQRERPAAFNLQLFFNAKSDELINIFSGAPPDEKNKVVTILSEVDPSNSNKYQKIVESR